MTLQKLCARLKSEKLLEALFLCGLSGFVFEVILFDSTLRHVPWLAHVFVGLRLLSYALIVFKGFTDFFCRRYSLKEIIGFGAVGIVLLLVARYSGYKDFLIYLAFIAAGHNVEYRKVIRAALFSHLAALAVIFAFCGLGIVPNNINIRTDGTVRQGLGFDFGGLLAHFVLYTILLWIYDRQEHIRIVEILFLLLGQLFVYYKTNTNNPFFLGCLALAGTALLKYSGTLRKFQKPYYVVALLMVPLAVGSICLLSYKYDSGVGWMHMLNRLLSRRLELGREAFNRYPVRWFGQPMEWNLKLDGYFYVDSSYLKILFTYGIATFCLFVGGLFLTSLQICRRKDIWFLLVLGIIVLHSMFDDQLPWIGSNTFMVCYSYFKLFSKNAERETHELSQTENQ